MQRSREEALNSLLLPWLEACSVLGRPGGPASPALTGPSRRKPSAEGAVRALKGWSSLVPAALAGAVPVPIPGLPRGQGRAWWPELSALFSCLSGVRVSSSWEEIRGREVQWPLHSGGLNLSGV